MDLAAVVDRYVGQATGLSGHCDRCLRTARWDGNAVLMVVDAAFTSVGLNYFQTVVPRVLEFESEFVLDGPIDTFGDLRHVALADVEHLWANERSWHVARSVAGVLDDLGRREDLADADALRYWANRAPLEEWAADPIGSISGVGITTYQYLRMMGGVDTAMPDGIVRRVIDELLAEADVDRPTAGDLELVRTIEEIADRTGHRPIELCWMTWLVTSESELARTDQYRDVLDRI